MTRTKVVLAVSLALAIGSVVIVATLERRAAASRDAQVSLAGVAAELTQLEVLPVSASMLPGSAADKMQRLAEMAVARRQAIERTLTRLRNDSPPEELRAVEAALNEAYAAMNQAVPVWFSPSEAPGAQRDAVLTNVALTLRDALEAIDEANEAYGDRATLLQTEALAGSAGVVAALLAAFGFFYRRSESSRHALGAKEQALRQTLSELEDAQRERARLLERTVEVAEHERMRVAADLHDGPIQQLTAVALKLDLHGMRIGRSEHADLKRSLAEIRDDLAREMGSLRRLMVDLRPPILDEGGLSAALGDCALQVLEGTGIRSHVESAFGKTRFAPELETVVYRVAREALLNAARHSGAERVDVALERDGTSLRLSIVDDGSGTNADRLRVAVEAGRLGLVGMRERVESVGGEWKVVTAPGAGMRIECSVPWREQARATESAEADLAA